MVAVRLARGWIGYDGVVYRAGDLVDVDAVTLAKLEANGVVTPSEDVPAQLSVPEGEGEGERRVAWAGPTFADPVWAGPTGEPTADEPDDTVDDDERTVAWAGPTGADDDGSDEDARTGQDRT